MRNLETDLSVPSNPLDSSAPSISFGSLVASSTPLRPHKVIQTSDHMEHNTDNLFADEDHEMESVPYERFVESHIAEYIQCTICLGVPMHPTITQCGRFHCKGCITK